MNRIDLSVSKFFELPMYKKDVVRKKGKLIYKYTKESEEIMTILDGYRNDPVFTNCSLATAFLYQDDSYYGYAMKYEKELKELKNLSKEELNQILNKLLLLLQKIREKELVYYDLHEGNIKVKNNEPFLLDMDSISYDKKTKSFDLHNQTLYLVEFILKQYLPTNKNFPNLNTFREEYQIERILNESTLDYLKKLQTPGLKVNDLPYMLLDELNDEEKVNRLLLNKGR